MFIELTGFDGTKISFNLDHIMAIMPSTARNGNKNEEGTKIVTVGMDNESGGTWVVQESYDDVLKLCEIGGKGLVNSYIKVDNGWFGRVP